MQTSIVPSWRYTSRVGNSERRPVNTWVFFRCTSPSIARNAKSWLKNNSIYRLHTHFSLQLIYELLNGQHHLIGLKLFWNYLQSTVPKHASFAFCLSYERRQVWPNWMKRRHWWMSWRDGRLSRAAYWKPNRPRPMQPCRKSPSPCRSVFVCVFVRDVCKRTLNVCCVFVSECQWPEDRDGEDQRENGEGGLQDRRAEEEHWRGAQRGPGERICPDHTITSKHICPDHVTASAVVCVFTQPLVDEAKQAVGNIKPESLSEIRSLRMPPDVIRDILEGVLRVMGIFDTSWVSMKRWEREREWDRVRVGRSLITHGLYYVLTGVTEWILSIFTVFISSRQIKLP